jgi:multidrug resistance efflux pump
MVSKTKECSFMRRMVLIPLLIVLAVIAIAGGVGYYVYDNYMYYNTDDAQVTGNIVSVSAPVSGSITALDVQLGNAVAAGQVIATIKPTSTAGVEAVDATGAPIVPKPITVISPIAGTIIQTSAVQGQDVTPGLPLVQVTNLNALQVTAYVTEDQLNNISRGQDVDIHIDAYADTTFTGKVQQIIQATADSFSLLPTQDNASGNFTKVGQRIPVVISLDGTTGKDIMPGMSAEVTIHLH